MRSGRKRKLGRGRDSQIDQAMYLSSEEITKGLYVGFNNQDHFTFCLLNPGQVHFSQTHLCSKTSSSLTKQTTSVSTVAFQSCPGGEGETQHTVYQKSFSQEHILIKKCSLGMQRSLAASGGWGLCAYHQNNNSISAGSTFN